MNHNNNKELNNNEQQFLECKETQSTDKCQEMEKKPISRAAAFQQQLNIERKYEQLNELLAEINDTSNKTKHLLHSFELLPAEEEPRDEEDLKREQLTKLLLEDDLMREKQPSQLKMAFEGKSNDIQGRLEPLIEQQQFLTGTKLQKQLIIREQGLTMMNEQWKQFQGLEEERREEVEQDIELKDQFRIRDQEVTITTEQRNEELWRGQQLVSTELERQLQASQKELTTKGEQITEYQRWVTVLLIRLTTCSQELKTTKEQANGFQEQGELLLGQQQQRSGGQQQLAGMQAQLKTKEQELKTIREKLQEFQGQKEILEDQQQLVTELQYQLTISKRELTTMRKKQKEFQDQEEVLIEYQQLVTEMQNEIVTKEQELRLNK